VAKIDGYVISVRGAGALVGSKRLVRLQEVGRTSATAVLLGEDGEPIDGPGGAGGDAARAAAGTRRRGRRGGRRRSRSTA
jgi:ribonuclease G